MRIYGWPETSDIGTFHIACSCNRWEFTGTAQEIIEASRSHDDAPWTSHVVTIRDRVT